MHRRDFLKFTGLASGTLVLGGAAAAGYMSGADKTGNTGWGRAPYAKDQFFNRKPFFVTTPTYEKVGTPQRIQYLDNLFRRNGELGMHIRSLGEGGLERVKGEGISSLPQELKAYYTEHPSAFEEFFLTRESAQQQRERWPEHRNQYLLAEAWSKAHASPLRGPEAYPPQPQGPPEEWDFEGVNPDPLKLKSPQHGSELIKKITHTFGATLVGVTAIKEEWVYQGILRGVGKTNFAKPAHWKNAIVFAIPHEWESFYANPTYGTSYEAYTMLRFIAGKLETFIREIGFSSRSHVPPNSYDLIIPPLAIDAGLGEQGRHGVVITPELGANTRLAAVSTDMPLEADNPVDLGIMKFCNKCKICAEECPSGAISFDDKPTKVIRGYRRWCTDQDKCFKAWNQVATSSARGCRVCLAVCPYSRKNNWIHTFARELDPRDPTGFTASAMLAMQKQFFDYPGGSQYLPPPDGNNKTYGKAPDWLRTEEWFDF
ncbi:MAG: reductive dehalogenase [Bacteroidetes bacterium]|nr:MAG: reductive dehalogenase [Bacteroidota bacterium]